MKKNTSGIIFMLLSTLDFTVVQSLVKYLGPSVGTWNKAFFRAFFGLATLVIWMLVTRTPFKFNNKRLLLVRGLMGGIGLGLSFWAIDLTGLSHATLYNYTYPAFAPVFAAIFFREKFKPWHLVPLAVALIGVFFLVEPFHDFRFGLGDLFGLINGVTSGMAIACVRELRKTETPESIYFSFAFVAVFICLAGIILSPAHDLVIPQNDTFPVWAVWVLLGSMGLFATAGQLSMTKAYMRLPTVIGAVLSVMTMPTVTIVAVLFFGETLSLSKIFGGVLIFSAGFFMALYEVRKKGMLVEHGAVKKPVPRAVMPKRVKTNLSRKNEKCSR